MFELIDNSASQHKIVLSIGSNIGKSRNIIDNALNLLISSGVLTNVATSSYYLTEPNGYQSQNWFLNISLSATTELDPYSLLFFIKSMEYQFGRIKTEELTDRIIDIDILFFDGLSINSKYLVLPHPRLHQRNFVLIPTIEIEPDLVHPVFQKSLQNLLNECNDNLKVIKQ